MFAQDVVVYSPIKQYIDVYIYIHTLDVYRCIKVFQNVYNMHVSRCTTMHTDVT